jgi:hypothetical protein
VPIERLLTEQLESSFADVSAELLGMAGIGKKLRGALR